MSKTARIIAVLLAWAAAARAQQAPAPAPPSRVVIGQDIPIDPRDFSNSLQRAIDTVASPGTVVVPPGVHLCYAPVWYDRSGVDMEGRDGAELRWQSDGPGIILGLPRRPAGLAIPADLRTDAFGALDASEAPKAGMRRGFRTYSESTRRFAWAGFYASAFSHGKFPPSDKGMFTRYITNWVVSDLTLEMVVSIRPIPGEPLHPGLPLLAVTGQTREAAPLVVHYHTQEKRFRLYLTTSDGAASTFILTPAPAADGTPFDPAKVHRLVVHASPGTGAVRAWIDGHAAAVDRSGAAASWGTAGLTLGANCCGGMELMGFTWSNDVSRRADVTYYGLRVSDADRYADADTLARRDGLAANDHNTFYRADDPGVLAALFLEQPPGPDRALRLGIPRGGDTWYGGVPGGLIHLDTRDVTWEPDLVSEIRWTGLKIGQWGGGANPWGCGVLWGDVRQFRAENVQVSGGLYGVYSPRQMFTSYPVYWRDCRFGGMDSAYHGGGHYAWFTNCEVSMLRHGYHFAGGDVHITGGFIPHDSYGESFARLHQGVQGSSLTLRDVTIDAEDGGRTPRHGVVWASTNPGSSLIDNKVIIENVVIYNLPEGGVFATFDDPSDLKTTRHYFKLSNITAPHGNALARVAPAWRGDIVGDIRTVGPPAVEAIDPAHPPSVNVTAYGPAAPAPAP